MIESCTTSLPSFLTADWRHLAMLNYQVPPELLIPKLPVGTELDQWQGKTLVSMVGFQFLNTRLKGLPIPLHRHFEEINLRFYVRRKTAGGWRRGVVFVRELVPKVAIATVARVLYEEPYLAVPMSHRIETDAGLPTLAEYGWIFRGQRCHLRVETSGDWLPLVAGGEAEFITEHYWGYTRRRDGSTSEYEVTHPPWRVMNVAGSSLDCDSAGLYGEGFREILAAAPESALFAEGSAVTVHHGKRLRP